MSVLWDNSKAGTELGGDRDAAVQRMKDDALVSCRELGCTCEPTITIVEPAPRLLQGRVEHARTCPVARRAAATEN